MKNFFDSFLDLLKVKHTKLFVSQSLDKENPIIEKKYEILYLSIILTFTTGCSSNNPSKDSLPRIDIRKNYPEKEIILTDIADISYVHLNTKKDDYLYSGTINYVTENTIIVNDNSSSSILFFTKNGIPKSRFSRFGQGPEEYVQRYMLTFLYDETTDDVFVVSGGHDIILYSSAGEFKRKLTLPQGTNVYKICSFDEQSLLVFDAKRVFQRLRKFRVKERENFELIPQSADSSFFLISKMDGKILDYVEMPNNDIDLSFVPGDSEGNTIPIYTRIVRCSEGFFLCNPETDTVFLYGKDKSLTPVICKAPLANDLTPKVILDNIMDVGRYQFMLVETLYKKTLMEKTPKQYYIRDKETGDIFRQKFIVPEYKGKEILFAPRDMYYNGKETHAHVELNLFDLKLANKEKRLSGKLKDLVEQLNEYEDNNVFMFVSFKQNL